jgi:hypothetical protein
VVALHKRRLNTAAEPSAIGAGYDHKSMWGA